MSRTRPRHRPARGAQRANSAGCCSPGSRAGRSRSAWSTSRVRLGGHQAAWPDRRRRGPRPRSSSGRWPRRRRPRVFDQGERRARSASSCRAPSLASRPRMGSATVRSACRRPRSACWRGSWWKPAASATWLVKNSKPPETRTQRAPLAAMVRTRVMGAGVQLHPARRATAAGRRPARPSSMATRSKRAFDVAARRARPARWMAATTALPPAKSASSSRHSHADDRRIHVGDQQPLPAPAPTGWTQRSRPAARRRRPSPPGGSPPADRRPAGPAPLPQHRLGRDGQRGPHGGGGLAGQQGRARRGDREHEGRLLEKPPTSTFQASARVDHDSTAAPPASSSRTPPWPRPAAALGELGRQLGHAAPIGAVSVNPWVAPSA